MGVEDVLKMVNPKEINSAILWLERLKRDNEEVVSVFEPLPGFVFDGVKCVGIVGKEMFGWIETRATEKKSMFGTTTVKSTEVSVEVDYGVYEKYNFGGFALPGIEGVFELAVDKFEEMPCAVIRGSVRKKDINALHKFADAVRERMLSESIYRGKALYIEPSMDKENNELSVLKEPPRFFKLNGFTPEDLILPEYVYADVNAEVFSAILDAEILANRGLEKKRTIVFNGRPGCGKTLCLAIIAGLCVREDVKRTYILCKDPLFLEDVIKMVHKYHLSPAAIAMEDVDRRMRDRDIEGNKLLNVLDGVDTKNLDIQFYFTTNDADSILEVFRRSGRCDRIINFPLPDAETAARLLKKYSIEEFRLTEEEYMQVGKYLSQEETLPANIVDIPNRAIRRLTAEGKEVVDLRMLMSLSRGMVEEKRPKNTKSLPPTGVVERIAQKLGVA